MLVLHGFWVDLWNQMQRRHRHLEDRSEKKKKENIKINTNNR
jgi:hypothetical protein